MQLNIFTGCVDWMSIKRSSISSFHHGLILVIFISCLLTHSDAVPSNKKGVWRRVEALSGREAVLPCEVGTVEESDRVYVVLWYKNGEKEPFYSYDNRPLRLQPAEDRHVIQSSVLKGRVSFRPGNVPALHIRPVTATDQANYTCRVDFRIASSRSTHLSLQVVVPASKPVLEYNGVTISSGDVIGPLHEEQPLVINCVVEGGEPKPSVIWYRKQEVIDSSIDHNIPEIKISARRERLKPRLSALRVLGLRSSDRQMKRLRMYKNIAYRGSNYHRKIGRRNLARGSNYRRRSVNRFHHSNFSSEENGYRDDRLTTNRLSVPRLSRNFHDEQLTCLASNNNVTAPTNAYVTIMMNLKPLTIKLVNSPKDLRMGQTYEIECLVKGSRPEPNITWTLGNVASLYHVPSQTEHTWNASSSTVRVVAERKIHGQKLTCLAVNSLFPDDSLSASVVLNVTYPPVASLELGRGVASVVKEGEDVYFNCMVDSNPPTYKISWFHENSPISHSPAEGFVVSGQSLALRNVRRSQAGKYICSASNVEGDAKSPAVKLHVSYAPVCSSESDTPQVLASGIGQTLNVSCSVIASPADVKFSWVFNNSVTSERVPVGRVYQSEIGGWSGVMFVAKTQQDYGTLQCWARNNVGKMNKPCLFHIAPAGRPDTPLNCSVINKTYDSLVVTCEEGFNGGLRQSFVSRVYEAVAGRGQVNVSSPTPQFILEGLTPGLDYVIKVSAINQMGESDQVTLEAFTYKMAENRMRDEILNVAGSNTRSSRSDKKGTIGREFTTGALLGAVVILLSAILLTGILLRCAAMKRNRRLREQRKKEEEQEANESEEDGGDKGVKERHKSSAILVSTEGRLMAGSRETGNVIFLPSRQLNNSHENLTATMLQRIPPDTETPFEIPSIALDHLDPTATLMRSTRCGGCRVDQSL